MRIIHKKDAIHVDHPEGTKVDYYLRDEYEVIYNEQLPHSTQAWHHHEHILETLFIIEGELTAKWREGGNEVEEIVHVGDMIETENTPHTFTNHTDKVVKFIVIKQVLSGVNKRDVMKADKVVDQ